jgi:hypothetical protein
MVHKTDFWEQLFLILMENQAVRDSGVLVFSIWNESLSHWIR